MRYISPNNRLEYLIREAEKNKPLAEGSSLLVFPHPFNNKLVIKRYRGKVTFASFSPLGIVFYENEEDLEKKFQFLNLLISTYPHLKDFIDLPYVIINLEGTYYTINRRGIPLNQMPKNEHVLNLLKTCRKAFSDAAVCFPEEDEDLSCYLYIVYLNRVVRTDIHSNDLPYCGTRIL
ncbi:MAG: hypothetical protein QW757_06075 [Candidatus Woesearchaeota archaeon]